jgi:hypothetical protein
MGYYKAITILWLLLTTNDWEWKPGLHLSWDQDKQNLAFVSFYYFCISKYTIYNVQPN